MKAIRMSPLEKYAAQKGLDSVTRSTAIAAHCQRCVGGDVDKGWREEIRHCEVDCELRDFRPYK